MMWQGRSVPTSQYPNRLVEFFGEDFYSKNSRAGGRQLNGERNAVKALTHASSERQVGVVSAKAWFDGAYASEKQLNCASPRYRSIRVIIARHLQRYDMVQTLTVNAQRFPTRGKYLARGIEPGKHMGELSNFRNDVFAIVQNEQCWFFSFFQISSGWLGGSSAGFSPAKRTLDACGKSKLGHGWLRQNAATSHARQREH